MDIASRPLLLVQGLDRPSWQMYLTTSLDPTESGAGGKGQQISLYVEAQT